MVSRRQRPKPSRRPRFGDQQVRRQHPRAAQHGVDPRQQFAGGEGFGQVIVGAHFQAEDAIGFVVAGGEHQDRRGFVLAGAQFTAQHQAVIAGHHQVQHDQVHLIGFQKMAHLPAVGNHGGAQAVLLQVIAHQLADLAIVIDDQDVVHMLHCSTLLLFACARCRPCGDLYRTVSQASCLTPYALITRF